MYKWVTLYRRVEDEATLEQFFSYQHLPLAEKLPGLLGSQLCRIDGKPGGQSRFHLSYELSFESQEALVAAIATPEGMALLKLLRPWVDAQIITWYYGSVWAS